MTAGDTIRVVFDCMVFLQAAARPGGPAAECLLAAGGSAFQLVVCDAILRELRGVLGRASIRRKNPRITDESVELLLERIRLVSHQFADPPPVVRLPRDPKDEVYVNLALEVGARYLVTRDNDLLDLMRRDTDDGKAFAVRFPNLSVLDPVAFLEAVRPQGGLPDPAP